MGWFHLTQLLDDPEVQCRAVVEPWYLGKGKDAPGSAAFQAFRGQHVGVPFYGSVDEIPALPAGPVLAVIAARTSDAPALFQGVVAKGVSHVYLEKPGATSAAALGEMVALAKSKAVNVIVGYNKNVAKYMAEAVAVLSSGDGPPRLAEVTLEHSNDFTAEDLPAFMQGPGGEGMVHNMMCHEIALSTSLFCGVTMANLAQVDVDPAISSLIDLPDGASDWSKLAFTLHLKPGSQGTATVPLPKIRLIADRCGGNYSCVHIQETQRQQQQQQKTISFRLPDPEHEKWVVAEQAKDPEIRAYFLQQSPDYRNLKRAFVSHIAAGKPGVPAGVVSLDMAHATLQLADLLAPVAKQCLKQGKAGGSYSWTPADGEAKL